MCSSSFKKRVKRRITGREHDFFAICSPGLKKTCYVEMQQLGFEPDKLVLSPGGVKFQARPDSAILANLFLRTPSRILMRIAQFKAASFEQLEKKISNIDWILYLPENSRLDIKVTTRKSRLYHSDAIVQRVKKIIEEQLTNTDTLSETPFNHTLLLRAENDYFTISLDTSGELLFKRGIKTKVTHAPLRETIAASMLLWNNLSQDDIVLDPMCGSGTFSLEAAMIKTGTPPGRFRSFAFESFPGFSQKTFQYMIKEADKKIKAFQNTQIFASDTDEKALASLDNNIAGSKFSSIINVNKQDFFSIDPTMIAPGQKGIIMLNPPYGKRLKPAHGTRNFYREVSTKLKSDFKSWRLGIILPSRKYMSMLCMGLKFRPVFHGGLEAVAGIGII